MGDEQNDRISVWTRPNSSSTDWTNQTTFGSFGEGASQFVFPSGLAVSSDAKTVWVADRQNERISVWALTDCS